MKVLILNGSPNPEGNTATLIHQLKKGMNAQRNMEICQFNLYTMDLHACRGCFQCMETGKCIIHDDMHRIYEKIRDTDCLVIGTPVYWWHMTAQMKIVIDRFSALLDKEDKPGCLVNKKIILIISYNFKACGDNVINMFRDFIDWIHIQLHTIEFCSRNGRVGEGDDAFTAAYQLGRSLGS